MAREDRGVEKLVDEERKVESGWQLVGEADCTRCAVRLTACALRRRPTTLLFEKDREGKGVKGDEGMTTGGRGELRGLENGRQRQR